ncbi:MAG: hypothetical protein HRU22_12020 [Gammaproteobacteria bacterium]|nr:hypothetical protein [Gammaproteobacteria bacterium]
MNKILISTILISMSCLATASTIEQRLIKCSQIETSPLRLSCFDTLTSTINIKQLNQSEKIAKQNTEVTAKESKQVFGFELKQLVKTPDEIVATITTLRKNPRGLYVVSIDNQQVWKQKSSSSFKLKLGDKVFIKKGALGSFFLGKEGRNKRIKVKRIK